MSVVEVSKRGEEKKGGIEIVMYYNACILDGLNGELPERSMDQCNLGQISVNALSARHVILLSMTCNMLYGECIIYLLRGQNTALDFQT